MQRCRGLLCLLYGVLYWAGDVFWPCCYRDNANDPSIRQNHHPANPAPDRPCSGHRGGLGDMAFDLADRTGRTVSQRLVPFRQRGRFGGGHNMVFITASGSIGSVAGGAVLLDRGVDPDGRYDCVCGSAVFRMGQLKGARACRTGMEGRPPAITCTGGHLEPVKRTAKITDAELQAGRAGLHVQTTGSV